jgi:hypothetical protein
MMIMFLEFVDGLLMFHLIAEFAMFLSLRRGFLLKMF